MKKILACWIVLAAPLAIVACGSGSGPDAISSHGAYSTARTADCLQCHTSATAPSLDPVVTNGAGAGGKHVVHVSSRNIVCETCHNNYLNQATHMNGTFDTGNPAVPVVNIYVAGLVGSWINNTGPRTGSCATVACHGPAVLDWYGTAGLPDCVVCHTGPLDPVTTNGTGTAGKHAAHVGSGTVSCAKCHATYPDSPGHMLVVYSGTTPTSLVSFDAANPNGAWINDTGPRTGSCASLSCHAGNTVDWYGAGGLPDCSVCHTGPLDPVTTNGAGAAGKHSIHVAVRNIPCRKCHAKHPDSPGHMSGTLDTANPSFNLVSFDATNPAGVWINDTGARTGSCASLACHAGDTVDWYGVTGWTMPACSTCHASVVGVRRQVLGAAGDFNKESHHVINYASRNSELVTPADCRVCHNMDYHTSGILRLSNKDTAQALVYQAANPAGLEPFCLSCHDANGATTEASPLTPFSDSNTLGTGQNIAGNKIAGYWANTYTAHKTNGLTCAGTGAPNTGCHGNNGVINMHGSAARGLLTRNVTNPIPPTQAFNENDYKLCFDCHENYPTVKKAVVLGYLQSGNYGVIYSTPTFTLLATPYNTSGIQSLFRDRYQGSVRIYDDRIAINDMIYTHLPLHNLHLLGSYYDSLLPLIPNWFIWNYRDDASQPGRITCASCHNVHGTSSPVRSTYDTLNLTSGVSVTNSITEGYTTLPFSALVGTVMTSYPTSCTMECHKNNGPSSYWHTPADE